MTTSEPPAVDFGAEWKLFVDQVRKITGLNDPNAADADTIWQTDFAPLFYKTKRIRIKAGGVFGRDIEFVEEVEYEVEKDFSDALFASLRNSIAFYCMDAEKGSKDIKLRGVRNIGFATELKRSGRLGLPSSYGPSMDSKADHSCVVFGNEVAGAQRIDEATAAVELKLSNTSCMNYTQRKKHPDLKKRHGALGQALMYILDVWNCLARRGWSVDTLATAVLAARRKGDNAYTDFLCCMEGLLVIPLNIGGLFGYRVGRCVTFPLNEAVDKANSSYKEAIAIYIKTMRIGLERAFDVRERMNENKVAVSLCCSQLRGDLQLLASPIPHARPASEMTISQGELYRLGNISGSIEEWLKELDEKPTNIRIFCKSTDDIPFTERARYVVKLSCNTVHPSLVHPSDSWIALEVVETLGPPELVNEISKSLVAAAFVARRCLVVVMKDLSQPDGTNWAVSPALFDSRLHLLWNAFAALVINVLIPLASLDIIHNDIRFNPTSLSVYNILGVKDSGRTELRLIDFESLRVCGSGNYTVGTQDFAISGDLFEGGDAVAKVALKFLFWQVLYAAFAWSPTRRGNLVMAATFVESFFTSEDDDFVSFRKKVGDTDLAVIHAEEAKGWNVNRILPILENVFAD
jgi:hypothetical protein